MESGRLNNWLTQLGNIGVLAGLAVLIIEIRQNNELTMAQIEQSRSEAFLGWRQEEVLSDHIAPLIAKVEQISKDMYGESLRRGGVPHHAENAEIQKRVAGIIDKLEVDDRVRYEAFILRNYWDFENLYFQYQRGLVSEGYWNERIVPSILINAPAWKGVVGGRLPFGRKEFNDEVERLLNMGE